MFTTHFIGYGSHRSAIPWSSFYVEIEDTVLVIFECNIDTYKFFAGTIEGNNLIDKYDRIIVAASSPYENSIGGLPSLIKYIETRPLKSMAAYQDNQKMMKIITPNGERTQEYINLFNRDFDGQVRTYEPERLFYEIMQTYEIDQIEYMPQFNGFGLYGSVDEKLGINIEYFIVPHPSVIKADESIDLSFCAYMLQYMENREIKDSIFFTGASGYLPASIPLKDLCNNTSGEIILTMRGLQRQDIDEIMKELEKVKDDEKIHKITLTGFNSNLDKQKYDNTLSTMFGVVGAE